MLDDCRPVIPTGRRPILFLLFFLTGCVGRDVAVRGTEPVLHRQVSGTDILFIGLDVLSDRVAWTAGTGGRYAWTVDGGASWQLGGVPGADTLQFRDVHAASADEVYLLSIGPGDASRVYRTTDRGTSWDLVFRNPMADAFYDCFDFWDDGSGLAFSDAVEGIFPIARSTGGTRWEVLPLDERPAAAAGEGGFAASGTCLVTHGEATAWIGTGNTDAPRVLRTDDRGATWTSSATPLEGGEATGIATLAFRDDRHGVALGGDLTRPDEMQENAVRTDDGGRTWRPATAPPFPGAVYGSTYVPELDVLIAVGPGGAAYSATDAASWTDLDSLSYWSVDAAGPHAAWAVGPEGRITKIEFAAGRP